MDPTNTFIRTSRYGPNRDPVNFPDGLIGDSGWIDINDFARQTTVLGNTNAVMLNQAAIDSLQKDIDRAFQGTALSAALVTTQPKAGDRFSPNLNAAEFESEAAVGLSFGFAPGEHFMFHLSHTRSSDTHLTRVGISASF